MVEAITQDIDKKDTASGSIFARHETFHPRFGWLKKGFDRALEDSQVFLRDDATVQLGIGKNMVRSLRYWESAFKLLKDDEPTDFGEQLLGENGWDTYLEDPASLWLLHWKLLEPPCSATAWDFTFNAFRPVEFTFEELFYQLCDYRDRIIPRIADSSLKKDVSCLLKMYVEQPAKSNGGEESLDCPFTQLGLIHTAGDSRHYTFRIGYKPTLPFEIIVYACLHHSHRFNPTARRIPLAKLLYDPGSPGLVFRLTESAIGEAIEGTARQFKQLGISDVAGKLEFFFEEEPLELAAALLDHYYQTA
ncbi:MAG: DUF4007 family protein [Desertifilum sp.]|nr:DUF4007 family protein [Desertifilum sp.]